MKWSIEDRKKDLFSHFEVYGHRSTVARRNKGDLIREGRIQVTPRHLQGRCFISAKGLGRIIPIEGMMNSEKYKDV